eukprot:15453206-Alexandrium_andersonii.AAC.1
MEPNVRSRYVANDVAFYKVDSMFAATHPLEALRLPLSDLATRRRGCASGRRRGAQKPLLIDERKAHLRAHVEDD